LAEDGEANDVGGVIIVSHWDSRSPGLKLMKGKLDPVSMFYFPTCC
jgi:hypothetical protein